MKTVRLWEKLALFIRAREPARSANSILRSILLGDSLLTAMCHLASLRDGLRVLIVDSDADSSEILTILFAEYGIETTIATSAKDAIAHIQQAQPDLLISEICLPGEDGYSLIHQVKALEAALQVHIPAIALTTLLDGDHNHIHSLTAGFYRHLQKPLNIDELITTVACLTGQSQAISAGPYS